MHQYTGHFPTAQSTIRAARPAFDVAETEEWLESLQAVVASQGTTRARFLMHEIMEEASRLGVEIAQPSVTPMVNTIPTVQEGEYPGDRKMEMRISDIVRWNAAVM